MKPDPQTPWLTVRTGSAPLLLCMPHTGTGLPGELAEGYVSAWLAQRDTDWHIERLYEFAAGLDATIVRTGISRSVIDPNRDPSGASLYPGQATTELCPTTTFDGEPLYHPDRLPDAQEIARRTQSYFDPYHAAIRGSIERLRARWPRVVVYDCHSIRSQIPRLFEGVLPNFNIGTFSGASCDAALTRAVENACDGAGYTRTTNGRFKGGYTTRHYGRPASGIHALQMELACRGYLREPVGPVDPGNWPVAWDAGYAASMRAVLGRILEACLRFAT